MLKPPSLGPPLVPLRKASGLSAMATCDRTATSTPTVRIEMPAEQLHFVCVARGAAAADLWLVGAKCYTPDLAIVKFRRRMPLKIR